MVWWLVKEYFSAMIRPLWFTAPSDGCVAVKDSTIVSYLLMFTNHRRFKRGVVVSFSVMLRPLWLTAPSGWCVAVKFSTIVSYLLTTAGSSMVLYVPYRNILQEACRMTYFNILHILQENYVFLLKYLAKCKRNGHNLARPCMNLTNQHLQDFLQVLRLCKILGLCRILLAWIVQESCKISAGSVAR